MTIEFNGVSGVAPASYGSSSGGQADLSATAAASAPADRDAAALANAQKAATVATPATPKGQLQFNVDVQTSQLVIQVVNGQTTEVIRRIPEENMAEFAQSLDSPTGNLVKAVA